MNKLLKNHIIEMCSLAVALAIPMSILESYKVINVDQMIALTVFQGVTIGLYLGVKLLIVLNKMEKEDE